MKEFCKFLTVLDSQVAERRDDVWIVEQCNTFDAELNFTIVLELDRVPDVIEWVQSEYEMLSSYVIEAFESKDYKLACTVLMGNERIDFCTEEFIGECGSVQAFIDRYHTSSPIKLKENFDDTPSDYYEEPGSEEPLLQKTETPVETPVAASIEEDCETLTTDVESGNDVDDFETNLEPENGTELMVEIPTKMLKGRNVIPFNSLVDLANYINEASKSLEHSEFADSYILQKDSLDYAVDYVDKFSPTFLKEFLIRYVKSADNDTDLIRVTKLLDALVEYSNEKKVRV